MASDSTPKEKLTAYQRWELHDFDPEALRQGVQLPTADQLQHIQQQAYQEGFAAGMKDGRAESQAVAHRMHKMMADLQRSMSLFEEMMAQEIMDLALDIARQMVRSALEADPVLVLAVIREAIQSLPQTYQHPSLALHPQDAQLVREMLAQDYPAEAWRIVEDPQMERGGCRVETGATEIDAKMESRWQRIVSALGSDAAWRK